MPQKATFYHAGCAVCVAAEQQVAQALDPQRYAVGDHPHLGTNKARIPRPTTGSPGPGARHRWDPYHINFGASLADVKGAA